MTGVSHERLRREGGVQWPCPAQPVGDHAGTVRLYADRRFPTPDGRARFAPTPHAAPAETPDPDFPLLLTTGRVADQWHTMTRTRQVAGAARRGRRADGDLHPHDADRAGLREGDEVRVVSRRGEVRLPLALDEQLPRGVAFAPFHWGALHAAAGAGALNALTLAAGRPDLGAARAEGDRRAAGAGRAAATSPSGGAPRRVRGGSSSSAPGWPGSRSSRRRCAAARPKTGGSSCSARSPGRRTTASCCRSCWRGTCGPGELELRPLSWYAAHGVDLRGGCRAERARSRRARASSTRPAIRHPYDALVLATGSRAFVPPMPGADLPHVDVFRTWRDVDALAATPARTRAVVVGGGLLGLEAAAGLRARRRRGHGRRARRRS